MCTSQLISNFSQLFFISFYIILWWGIGNIYICHIIQISKVCNLISIAIILISYLCKIVFRVYVMLIYRIFAITRAW